MYTVVPRLLSLIDNTTNWYIRFNRRRLKGENGVEDTLHALNSLFEVIFTLCRGLAPFTPFLTDHIYKKLHSHIPEAVFKDLHCEDSRSIHFLPFPDVRQELYDAVVERRVGRMQKVIELARISRERRTIGLKTPLKTLVVIHRSQEYLDDLKSLESYITEELNVRDLVLTSDEDKYNVQYSVVADWPVLGKKLKKDMARVKKALPNLTSEDVKKYQQDKEMMVDGIRLEEGDLVVRRGVKVDEASKHLETNTDSDVLTILDSEIHPELAEEGMVREIINRVQRLRKAAGLQPTDDIKMEYKVLTDPENIGLERVFENQGSAFEKALRRPVEKQTDGGDLIKEGEMELQQATFNLRLLKL